MSDVSQSSVSLLLPSNHHEKLTHFNDIGSLAHEKIFGYLDPEDLQIVRGVCKRWLYLINNKFGIKVVIDNRNTELVHLSPWITEAQLMNLTRPIPPDNIAFAQRLRELSMKGMVVSYNFIPLLQACTHIQSITFDEPTIDLPSNIMKTLTPSSLYLPKCTRLEFICWNFTDSLNTIIIVLTMVKFGNLREIFLRSVHPPMLPLGLVFARSPRAIGEGMSPFMTLILKNLDGLELLSVGTMIVQNKFVFLKGSGKEEGSFIQLDELHLQNLYMSWTPILENQNHLNKLIIGHCQAQQWAEIRTCITRCQTHLRKIELQGRTFGVPWDCDVFRDCVNLEQLHINLSLSPKRNLNALPLSLVELSIDGPIELHEIENLELLTTLRKLYLNSLGLNLMILFPGNQDEIEERNQDMIGLRLFCDLILNLTSLELLSFKDCSQDSLDWSSINTWCRGISSDLPLIVFHDNFYEIHGQRIQHGLTLKIPPGFNRQDFNIPNNIIGDGSQELPRSRPGFIGNVLRIFGIL